MEQPALPTREVTLMLVFLGFLMALIGEVICFFIVYNKNDFRKLQDDTIKLWKEYYQLEAECGSGADGRVAGRAGRAAALVQQKIQKKNKGVGELEAEGDDMRGVVVSAVHAFNPLVL